MKRLLLLVLLFPVLSSYSQKWEKNYDYVDDCVCGLAKVKKGDKIGYVNKEGKEVIAVVYDEGLTFNEGFTAAKKAGKWLYFDSTGKEITQPVFDDALAFSGGLAAVSRNAHYGYINTLGEVVIPLQFSNAHPFSEGLAPAENAKGFWGYIDSKGNWAIAPSYDFTDVFANGEARVMKGGKMFYIDKKNNELHE